jgi:NAD(P)H-dependent FMN reductase
MTGAQSAGASVTFLDLRDIPLPLFDEDLESKEGLPSNGRKLKDMMLAHDGFLISSPEYNSSISGVLKNAIDWASRPAPGEATLACFKEKVAAIMSASPGAFGGLRGLVHVRAILGNIHILVLPDQVAVSKASEAFNQDGALKDAKQQAAVTQLGTKLTNLIARIKS